MGRWPPGIVALGAAHFLAWALIQPLGAAGFASLLADPASILRGELWRLLSGTFAVPDLGMLVWVALALLFIAPEVERRMGTWRFVILYLGAGGAAAGALALLSLVVPGVGALGGPMASNLAVLAAFAWSAPDARVLFFLALPVRAVHLLYAVVALRALSMWQAQAFLWPVACEFLGLGVAALMLRRGSLPSFHPIERWQNWRYRKRMQAFVVHPGGRRPPRDYLQ